MRKQTIITRNGAQVHTKLDKAFRYAIRCESFNSMSRISNTCFSNDFSQA